MNIPTPAWELAGGFRPAPPVIPLPVLGPCVPVEPAPLPFEDDPLPGPQESSEGSHLSGAGYSFGAGPATEPWNEAVRAYFEDIKTGEWGRALRRAGSPPAWGIRLAALRSRWHIELKSYTVTEAHPVEADGLHVHAETMLVTVFEELQWREEELSRAATYRVERHDHRWQIVGVEGWRLPLCQLDQALLWAQVRRRLPRRMLEQGLGASIWVWGKLGRDPRAGLWCWAPRLPGELGWLTLGLYQSSRRWRSTPIVGAPLLGSLAVVEMSHAPPAES